MAQLNETRGTANFLVSEANGMYRSRDVGTVAAGAAPGLIAGTILGKLTSGGNYVAYDPGAATGAQTIAGILFEVAVGTVKRTVVTSQSRVTTVRLTVPMAASKRMPAMVCAPVAAPGS